MALGEDEGGGLQTHCDVGRRHGEAVVDAHAPRLRVVEIYGFNEIEKNYEGLFVSSLIHMDWIVLSQFKSIVS
jgi:hypothetical protein